MRLRIVDAFTDRPFAGNPAAVLLLPGPGTPASPRWPADSWMQAVAAEMNLSETSFATPRPGDEEADWSLRWFTPSTEVDLCGHATLATAHTLFSSGLAAGPVRFATRSGVLTTSPSSDGAYVMDFPTATLTACAPPPGLAEALGAVPVSVSETGTNDLLVELPEEESVRALAPDPSAIARLHRAGGVIVTARATVREEYDFVSRYFCPALGINEDPVTGSAHTALAPFWAARYRQTDLTGRQVSARGGRVRVALRAERTFLIGEAVTVSEGELLVPLP